MMIISRSPNKAYFLELKSFLGSPKNVSSIITPTERLRHFKASGDGTNQKVNRQAKQLYENIIANNVGTNYLEENVQFSLLPGP